MIRRKFLTHTVACAGVMTLGSGALAGLATRRFFAANRLPIGLQLYTLAPQLEADFGGTLAAVARIGFGAVEIAGFHGRSGAQLRAAFDEAGLVCRSAHIPFRPYGPSTAINGDISLAGDIGTLAAEMHAIGVETVVLPMFAIPSRWTMTPFSLDGLRAAGAAMTADDWKATADLLNRKGRALAAYGLKLNYHNHNFEFAPVGGTRGYDILLAATDPALVGFELDVGWAAAADVDTLGLLKAHPDRIRQMHVKDIKASTKPNFALLQEPTEVGRGKIDWTHILPAAHVAGVREFYVEQEPPYAGDRLALIETSYRYLRRVAA